MVRYVYRCNHLQCGERAQNRITGAQPQALHCSNFHLQMQDEGACCLVLLPALSCWHCLRDGERIAVLVNNQ